MSPDQLAENQLVTTLKEVRQLLDEFKGRQPTSGASGVMGYVTQTTNQWDLNQTVAGGLGTAVKIRVTFTGDGSQSWPIQRVLADIFFNGTADADRPKYDAFGRLWWTSGSLSAGFTSSLGGPSGGYGALEIANASDELVTSWTFDFTVTGTVAFYLKAYSVGSSPGTLTVERVL